MFNLIRFVNNGPYFHLFCIRFNVFSVVVVCLKNNSTWQLNLTCLKKTTRGRQQRPSSPGPPKLLKASIKKNCFGAGNAK